MAKLQGDMVTPEVAALYRCVIASVTMLALCIFKKVQLRFSLKNHLYICLLGISLFSLNFILLYKAVHYLVSGIVAVIFSMVSFVNIINEALFFRKKPTVNVVVGALMGVGGLCIFFFDELSGLSENPGMLTGLALTFGATLAFSLGNMISKRNQNNNLDVLPAMTMALVYGTLIVFLFCLSQSSTFILPNDPLFWAGAVYLGIPCTVIAFLCYLKLVNTLGPSQAGYTTVVFPMIALVVSWGFEGYQWSFYDLAGLSMVMAGNVLVMRKKSIVLPNKISTNKLMR